MGRVDGEGRARLKGIEVLVLDIVLCGVWCGMDCGQSRNLRYVSKLTWEE